MVSTLTFLLTFVCGALIGVVGVFIGVWLVDEGGTSSTTCGGSSSTIHKVLHLTSDSDATDDDTDTSETTVWRYATDVLDPSVPANSHEGLPQNRLVVEQSESGEYRCRKLSDVLDRET